MVASLLVILCIPSVAQAKWHTKTFNSMGTRAHVEFFLDESQEKLIQPESLMALVTNEMLRLDQAMSPYIETSELSLVNAEAFRYPVKISIELFGLLEQSFEISVLSKGAFDITYASIGYQYDYRNNIKPSEEKINKAIPSINYRSVLLDKKHSTVRFADKGVKIDLGGIAKGYAIKQCLELLKQKGIKNALMNAGGDTALLGDRNDRPWIVGIKHPRSENKNAVHIPLENEAISTSGDYERYFIENGIRYHHIINPKTGDSARELVSVSVIGNDATFVDALSTTVFVKGLKEGMSLINSLEDYEAIIIDNEQRLHFSKGLQQ